MHPRATVFLPAAVLAAGLILSAPAHARGGEDYTVKELLEPCMEGDNDSRDGAALEMECEQYIGGFTDAYVMLTDGGKQDKVCLPEQNRPDEVRWAFMRWAHNDFKRAGMTARDGLLATVKHAFPCK